MTRQNRQKPAVSERSDGKERAYFCRDGSRQKVCRTGKSPLYGTASPPYAGCAGIMQAARTCKRSSAALVEDYRGASTSDPSAGYGGSHLKGSTQPASPRPGRIHRRVAP